MVKSETLVRSNTFKVGWALLLVVAALFTLNHIVLSLVISEERTLFLGWAAFNVYALLVIAIPLRHAARWAWITSWVLVAVFASAMVFNAQIGPYYLGAAAVMTVGLLLTAPAFFSRGLPSPQC
jgi:hypothetical protein